MQKQKNADDILFDRFARSIWRGVYEYVQNHMAEYEVWLAEQEKSEVKKAS